jgi:hypothetical protein
MTRTYLGGGGKSHPLGKSVDSGTERHDQIYCLAVFAVPNRSSRCVLVRRNLVESYEVYTQKYVQRDVEPMERIKQERQERDDRAHARSEACGDW